MRQSRSYGGVVCHRWFAGGAGWAFHPDVAAAGLAPANLPGMKSALENRDEPGVCFPVDGGIFLGEHVADPDCPDPKAQGRNPTILRAVYLPRMPKPEQAIDIITALRNVTPTASGPDASLTLPAQFASLVRTSHRWLILPAVAVLAGIIVFVVQVCRPSSATTPTTPEQLIAPTPKNKLDTPQEKLDAPTPKATPGELDIAADAMKRWLAVDGDRDAIINAYFERLSRKRLEGVLLEGSHPDVAFAKRFPEMPASRMNWDAESLRSELQGLLQHLGGQDSGNSPQALLARIDDRADYAKWLTGWEIKAELRKADSGLTKMLHFPLDAATDPRLAEFARSLSKNAADADKELAKALLEVTEFWGIKGIGQLDAGTRPELVFRTFAAFLTTPLDTGDNEWSNESVENALVKKLVRAARGIHSRARTAKEPAQAVRDLLKDVFAYPKLQGGASLRQCVEESIAAWRKATSDKSLNLRASNEAHVRDFVERLLRLAEK